MSNPRLCMTALSSNTTEAPTLSTRFNQQRRIWQARLQRWRINWRTRRQLTQLDHSQLKDIGVSLGDATEEARKPFWRN